MADNNTRTNTSTQIRNMYSDGMSYMNIKFYNTNLSFQLAPFTGRDQNNRSIYDTKNSQQTTVNFEDAFAIYQVCNDIINGKTNETNLTIPCKDASLTLERKIGISGQMETVFSINKNNMIIPFRFKTVQQQVKDERGQIVTKIIETGLGAFMKTIEGYLTGINADRHLDKLTDDYAKMMESRNNGQQQGDQQQNYKAPYNNKKRNNYGNNNYRNNNYQNNYNNRGPQGGSWNGGQQQNMSSYNLQN